MSSTLEHTPAWEEIVALKDELSLRELAGRFDTTPSQLSAAFKRTRTSRNPLRVPVEDHQEPLPPEPGESAVSPSRTGEYEDLSPVLQRALANLRAGSKDMLIGKFIGMLGSYPDAEVAAQAGVSVRTVASFRARHEIPGYKGPRRKAGLRNPRKSRIDPFVDLVGKVPDRVVAEKSGVSVNAVRNYRVKRGIQSARRVQAEEETFDNSVATPVSPLSRPSRPQSQSSAPPLSQQGYAYTVRWMGSGTGPSVVVAGSLPEAVTVATRLRPGIELVELKFVGPVVA